MEFKLQSKTGYVFKYLCPFHNICTLPQTPIFDGIFFKRLLSDTILCTDDVIQLDGVRLSNPGGTSNNLVGIICPLVGIGFTELLISGGEGGRGLAPQTPR